ncbi:MAG: hypothetical protein U9O96_00940 [Candidatus Thermoplasmatota archaeon]|nr:hypothetical protein [Candidatus Thermoplasmatota archaeon]
MKKNATGKEGETGIGWASGEVNKIIGNEKEYRDVLFAIESAIVSRDDESEIEDVDVMHSLKNLIEDPWKEYGKRSIEWKIQKNLKVHDRELGEIKACLHYVLDSVRNHHDFGPRGYLDFIRDWLYPSESEEDLDQLLHGMGMPTPDELMYLYDKSMKEKYDSIPISLNIKVTTLLNKYPIQWIDGICRALGIPVEQVKKEKVSAISDMISDAAKLKEIINNLSADSQKILHLVYGNGGWVSYERLAREFGGEEKDSWWWDEKPPSSPIGHLRLRALLGIGNSRRMDKVVVIPMEVMEGLKRILNKSLGEFG